MSEMSKKSKTNNLNSLIDPIFNRVNRLFVLSFENEDDTTFFSKYYTPNVEMKNVNIFIDGKCFRCSNKKYRRNIQKNY